MYTLYLALAFLAVAAAKPNWPLPYPYPAAVAPVYPEAYSAYAPYAPSVYPYLGAASAPFSRSSVYSYNAPTVVKPLVAPAPVVPIGAAAPFAPLPTTYNAPLTSPYFTWKKK